MILLVVLIVVAALLILFFYKKPNKYKAFVLVRVSNPTVTQLERYYEWKRSMSTDYGFEILSDQRLRLPNLSVNVVYREELLKKWPKILKMGGICHAGSEDFKMFTATVEHYILCVKKINVQFKHLWIIDQDLGYSGNIYEFMKQYENDNVDVILKEPQRKSAAWWGECYTPEYYNWRIKYHYGYKLQSFNFITRLSNNAINKIYNEFELGRHVFNEEAIVERIKPLKLTYKNISSNNYGYKLDWNTHVSFEEWNKILKDPKNQSKLFHTLKF